MIDLAANLVAYNQSITASTPPETAANMDAWNLPAALAGVVDDEGLADDVAEVLTLPERVVGGRRVLDELLALCPAEGRRLKVGNGAVASAEVVVNVPVVVMVATPATVGAAVAAAPVMVTT